MDEIERKVEWDLRDAGVDALSVSLSAVEGGYDGTVDVSRLTFRDLDVLARILGTKHIDFAPRADVREYSTVSGYSVDGRIEVRFREAKLK